MSEVVNPVVKDNKADVRCGKPNCKAKVKEDMWCVGCRFYICDYHEINFPIGCHKPAKHWCKPGDDDDE